MSDALISVFGVIIFLICFDIYLVLKKGNEETISVQLSRFSSKYPIVAFLIGLVMGHIFW